MEIVLEKHMIAVTNLKLEVNMITLYLEVLLRLFSRWQSKEYPLACFLLKTLEPLKTSRARCW
jgi:hypothetical protein